VNLDSLLLPLHYINEACFDGPAARMSAAGFFYFHSPAANFPSQALTRMNSFPEYPELFHFFPVQDGGFSYFCAAFESLSEKSLLALGHFMASQSLHT
jgi:hypothetical protein